MNEPVDATTSIPRNLTPASRPTGPAGNGAELQRGSRAGRSATVAVLIVSLLAAGLMRHVGTRFQENHSPGSRRTTTSNQSLAGLDTYALALLLGGLRGPLVMILWANSESQKSERDLQGLDTQIDWIRRLQPEFDSVHLFQIWNKAYNISVQMVGLANKYTVILDALDYGQNVDAERPDNLNILREIGRIYADKLGNSYPERSYYRERIRNETRYREQAAPQGGQPGLQRLAHDSLLDPKGKLLEKYLKPSPSAEKIRGNGEYDGSELQFLKKYEPFPFGVSTYALGYNYHKRSQVLMDVLKQKPLQISESVQDSQPALTLKGWAEEEWERGRRLEFKALGIKPPFDRLDQELPTAALSIDTPFKDRDLLPELIHCYEMCVRLADDSTAEYERHLSNPAYATKRALYANHLDTMLGMRGLAAGDADYLRAMRATVDRNKWLNSAARHYRDSIRDNALTAVRYYTSDAVAAAVLPRGVTRATVGTGPPGSVTAVTEEDMLRIINGVWGEVARRGGENTDENWTDRQEYQLYINRALERLKQIDLAARPAS